jgi:hypothetical protein
VAFGNGYEVGTGLSPKAESEPKGSKGLPEAVMGMRGPHAHKHFVQFYETDAFLVATVREHVLAALQGSDAAVVIATPAHCDALRALLRDEIDVSELEAAGRLTLLDASSTLDAIMIDGHPDPTRFREVVGSVIAEASGDGRALQAFGEMVALLWAEGNVVAALELEELWNDLATKHAFTLLCAYPLTAFEADPDTSAFDAMCNSHAAIAPAERHSILTRSLDRLRVLDRTRNEFIAMVVHDIRTPTIVIGEFLKILRNNWTSMSEAQIGDLLDRSIDNTTQINQLVSDILTTARLESGEFTFEHAPFELPEVIYRAVAAVRDASPHTNFEVDLEPNLPTAFGDEARQIDRKSVV